MSLFLQLGRKMSTILIGSYWGPRSASAKEGVTRITKWVGALAASGLDGLDEWQLRRPQGMKAFSAGILVCPEAKLLRQMKNEITRQVMPEFGWSLSIYTAQGGRGASGLEAHFGSQLPTAPNFITLTLRTPTKPTTGILAGLMNVAVELFQPDHAAVLEWDRPDPMDERPVWQRSTLAAYPT